MGCTVDPEGGTAPGWELVVSGEGPGEMVNQELVLKISVEKRCMSFLSLVQCAKPVTWPLLTTMSREGLFYLTDGPLRPCSQPDIRERGSTILHQQGQQKF